MKKLFTKVVRVLAVILMAFCTISIGAAGPASAADIENVTAVPVAGPPGEVTIVATSHEEASIPLLTRKNNLGFTVLWTLPGGTQDVPTTTTLKVTGLVPGDRIQSELPNGHGFLYLYIEPELQVTQVTPLVPTGNGTIASIPVADGPYVYKNQATGEVLQPGAHLLVEGVPLVVVAESTSADVTLTTTGPWSFSYVPPTPTQERAEAPLWPTFIDKCSTENDAIDYPKTLTRGLAKYVTGDGPDGTTVVTAAFLEGFVPPRNAPVSWSHAFTNVPCEPVTEPKPEPKPNPVDVPAAPQVNQPAATTPVVTQAGVTTGAQQTAVTSGTSTDRNYTVRGAASGASTASPSAWPLVAAGTLLLAAVVAVTRRRSATGASE